MLRTLIGVARTVRDEFALEEAAKEERRRDRRGLGSDPGVSRSVEEALVWIGRAQDNSASQDGGVSRHYSLTTGWASSYPETTGYIIPTMLHCAARFGVPEYRDRARRMLDWLVSIQMENGAFQGGLVTQEPVVPVTFNTGQILLGLVAGTTEFGDQYREPMLRAARWLAETQDPDGAWRQFPSPFTESGDKVYDTHVAWALFEAARVAPKNGFEDAGMRNVHWAITRQLPNGWFADCDLLDPTHPLTHTIGYVLRGVIEAYRYAPSEELLAAARKTADSLLTVQTPNGFIPGRLNERWEGTVRWACLTGSVQLASCWLYLYEITNDARYRDAALRANGYVRRTIRLAGPETRRGGIKGSFPVDGDYGKYEYLNWAAKFFIDANLLEQDVVRRRRMTW